MKDELKKERKSAGLSNPMIEINKGYGFPLLYPSVDFFLKKIDDGENFKYIRFNHGALDAFVNIYQNIDNLKKSLDNGDLTTIANKLQNEYAPFSNWHSGKNLNKQIQTFVNFLFNLDYPNSYIGFDTGIGMGGGVGVFDPKHPTQIKRLKVLNYILDGKDIDIYHTGLPKHWAIMGDVPYLMDELKSRNIKIIFLSPPYTHHIISKFDCDITHIEIPYKKANEVFYDKIEKIKDEAINANVVVFHSTGHTLSSVLVHELKDMNVSTFDVGRGFDWLLRNEPKKVPHYGDGWLNYFGGETENRYKNLIIKLRNTK